MGAQWHRAWPGAVGRRDGRLRREDFELIPEKKAWERVPRRPFFHSRFPLFKAGSAGIPAASGDEGVMTNEKFFELGYRIEEIASSRR